MLHCLGLAVVIKDYHENRTLDNFFSLLGYSSDNRCRGKHWSFAGGMVRGLGVLYCWDVFSGRVRGQSRRRIRESISCSNLSIVSFLAVLTKYLTPAALRASVRFSGAIPGRMLSSGYLVPAMMIGLL